MQRISLGNALDLLSSEFGPLDPAANRVKCLRALNFVTSRLIHEMGGRWKGHLEILKLTSWASVRFPNKYEISAPGNTIAIENLSPPIDSAAITMMDVEGKITFTSTNNLQTITVTNEDGQSETLAHNHASTNTFTRIVNITRTIETANVAIAGMVDWPASKALPTYVRYLVDDLKQYECHCRKGWVALTDETQNIYPANLSALRYGLKAFIFEEADDMQRANMQWTLAVNALNTEVEATISNNTTFTTSPEMGGSAFRLAI